MHQQAQQPSVFDSEIPLPNPDLTKRAATLLGFNERYARVHDRLQLLLRVSELPNWSKKHHGAIIPLCDLIAEQYPLYRDC